MKTSSQDSRNRQRLRLNHSSLILSCGLLVFMAIAMQPSLAQQADVPVIGDPAPEIRIEQLLQAPPHAQATLESLKGKVVILEFWATWCGPCIPAMDHLQAMAAKLKDKPVQVIAITAEEAGDVNEFLKRKPSSLWIGLDTDESAFKTYRPGVIPHSVVIDQKGRIAAITAPENVTEQAILDVLEGKVINLPVKASVVSGAETMAQLQQRLDAKTVYKSVMQRTESPNGMMKGYDFDEEYKGRRMTLVGVGALQLLAKAYNIPNPHSHIIDRAKSDARYDVDVIVPRGKEQELLPHFKNLVLTGLNIEVERQKQEMDVWVLRRINGAGALQPSKSAEPFYEMRGPSMKAVKQPIKVLTEYVGNFKKEPVVDETGLEANYDFALKWTFAESATLLTALKELGLEIVKDKRSVEVFIVTKSGEVSKQK